jgi:hypothetical protein
MHTDPARRRDPRSSVILLLDRLQLHCAPHLAAQQLGHLAQVLLLPFGSLGNLLQPILLPRQRFTPSLRAANKVGNRSTALVFVPRVKVNRKAGTQQREVMAH